MKMKTSLKAVLAVLAVVFAAGLAITVFSASKIISEKNFIKKSEHSYAVVSHLKEAGAEEKYYVIAFSAEGNRYEKKYEEADAKTYIGQTIDVYYQPGNPDNYRIKKDDRFSYYLRIGIIITAFSLLICAVVIAPFIMQKQLLKNGKTASCRVIKVKRGRFSSRIYCDSSKFKKRKGKPFVSGAVREKLPKSIKESSLTVYYSAKNPNRYFVDTRNL